MCFKVQLVNRAACNRLLVHHICLGCRDDQVDITNLLSMNVFLSHTKV